MFVVLAGDGAIGPFALEPPGGIRVEAEDPKVLLLFQESNKIGIYGPFYNQEELQTWKSKFDFGETRMIELSLTLP
jgi:hypothetical protein